MIRLAIGKWKTAGMLMLAAGIAAADQLIKALVSRAALGQAIVCLPPLFEIVRTENSGAAFSLLSGKTALLLGMTTLMLAALLAAVLCFPSLTGRARWALAVLFGGGAGNWIDRFSTGRVSDYIHLLFFDFPVFNLADICITLSVAYLILLLLTDQFEVHKTGDGHGTDH